MIASTYPLSHVILLSLFFVPVILWVLLVAYVFRDLFRNTEMSGVKKAWWTLVQFVLPLIGSLLYLLINARSINQRELRPSQLAEAQEEIRAIRTAHIALELQTGEALEMAHAAFAAQSDQAELVAQAAQDAKSAQAAIVLQSEEMRQLAQSMQTVKSVLNEQSDQLSQLAQTAQAARVALGEQSATLEHLGTDHELALATHCEQLSQAWARVTEVAEELRLEQAEHLEVLTRLSETVSSKPLGLEVDDFEEYIRKVARSKE